MRRLVFGTVLFFGFVSYSLPLHAQSVTLNICNTGKVDVDAILLQSGKVSSTSVGPADCATVAESAGGMRPAYVGFAFADSKGQWGAARRLDILPALGRGVLTDSPQSVSVPRGNRNVAVELPLLFSPPNPTCTTYQTSSEAANLPLNATARQRAAAANADAARGSGDTVCDTLVFRLNVEAFPATGEVTFKPECDPCDKKAEARRTPEERAAEQRRAEVVNSAIDTASGMGPGGAIFRSVVDRERQEKREESAARESRLSLTQRVNWSDLLPALRSTTPSRKLWDVAPRNLIIRGTVAGVEVSQDTFEPDTQWVDIAFRESPVTDVGPNRRPYSEFNVCTSNQDLLRDVFGANFQTAMIGKIIEVEGESQAAYCRGLLGSIRVTLAHQMRPATSARFAADARVWVPPPVAAPRPPTNAEIEASITSNANMVAADVELRAAARLSKACAEQSDKAHAATPQNFEAINLAIHKAIDKEYFACKAAVDEGAKKEAEKARGCAVQASKVNAARGPSARKDINKDLEPCFQLSASTPRAAPVPTAAPAPTPSVAPNPAPIPAPAAPLGAPAQRSTPAPSAPDPAAAAAARAKAEQEQQQRIAEQQAKAQQEQQARLAEQERIKNQALQKAQDVQACMQQVLKDFPDGGRSNPQAYQSRIMACAQVAQRPAK